MHQRLGRNSASATVQQLLSLLRAPEVAGCRKCCWSLGLRIAAHPDLRALTNKQLILLAKILQNGNQIWGFAPGRQQDAYNYLNHLLDDEWGLNAPRPGLLGAFRGNRSVDGVSTIPFQRVCPGGGTCFEPPISALAPDFALAPGYVISGAGSRGGIGPHPRHTHAH